MFIWKGNGTNCCRIVPKYWDYSYSKYVHIIQSDFLMIYSCCYCQVSFAVFVRQPQNLKFFKNIVLTLMSLEKCFHV